jgi:hypothetical protein
MRQMNARLVELVESSEFRIADLPAGRQGSGSNKFEPVSFVYR